MNDMKIKENWNEKIRNNFDNAAKNYLAYSSIQKHFCYEIVSLLDKLSLKNGKWCDLGSGIGFLADEIENKFPTEKVCRIDFSKQMLLQNKKNSETILWDLNNGLPQKAWQSYLLVSNFCLHWLSEPDLTLRYWFNKLEKGGYLLVCLPTSNSFSEWKYTCEINNFEYSGLTFPESQSLVKYFKSDHIFSMKEYKYQETFQDVYQILRNIINIGAHSSKSKRKTISELRAMQKLWPKNKNNSVNLTWEISIFILRK